MEAAEAFERVKRQGILPSVIARLDEIFAPLIREYVEDRGRDRGSGGSKAFKDAVWGMIDLTEPEVVVADSPPLQRLRRVRQLGFGYLTYPTAGYSRFEHTLGAVHQTERMIIAVSRRSRAILQRDIIGSLRTVRLAALLHDCGHMPASHVSERFFEEEECQDPDLLAHAKAIRADVAHAFKASPEVRLAECLSVCLIATPSFYGLLSQEARYTPEEIATAALAIAGKAARPDRRFIAQLISNAIDADKLDYMFRDSFFTRVPLAIDLERLLYKLKCEEVAASELPSTASRGMPKDSRPWVLATDIAGDGLAYDVSQTRKMLYSRVYFHHKTRAAERIGLEILEHAQLRPEDLLEHDDNFFTGYAAEQGDPLAGLSRRISWRRLPRRGFAISDYFLDPPAEEKRVEWVDFADGLADPKRRKELEAEIEAECETVAELLKRTPADSVYLDPRAQHPDPGGSSLLVSRPDNTFVSGQGFAPDAAAETQDPTDAAHVFFSGGAAEPELVYIAAERVMAREFDLFFSRQAADQAKVDIEKVVDLKRDLEIADPTSFAEFGRLRASPALVDDASLAGRIDEVARNFHHYTTVPEVTLSADRVRRFLGQLPEQLVEPMLEGLERITFLNRARLGSQFADSLIERSPEQTVFVPLTSGYGKSAAHIPYFLSDRRGPLDIRSLKEALTTEQPLVVFDDVLVSGTQSMKILKTWFGRRNPPYKGEPVLDEAEQAALRDREVSFHFAWAWNKGIERLGALGEDLGIGSEVHAVNVDDSGPALDSVSSQVELRGFLKDVGKAILLSTKGQRKYSPWSEEKCERSALGYNNDERLVVIEYNTPTGTITPLWGHGTYRNAPWLPLLPRRQRTGPKEEGAERGEVLAGEG
jgi:deoxynucleoside triphosphate triphosphohydrolase SAMHD1